MNAGDLRHRVTLQGLQDALDSHGDPVRGDQGERIQSWADIATVWAAINPLSAREFVESAAKQSQVMARITIRYRSDVDASCRIVHGDTIYNIQGILADPDSGLEYLTLPVSEGVSDGE